MSSILTGRGLTKRFGGLVAVDGVDFDVAAGEIHALIGPNGAGKTTLLNLVTGIYPPTSGSLTFENRNLLHVAPHHIARLGIARTFQHVELFAKLTVLENVLIGAHTRGRAGLVSALLGAASAGRERAAIEAKVRDCIDFVGLGAAAGRTASALTGGQGRLLGLARALASEPRLILLDELVAGLNSRETAAAAVLVKRLRDERGMTILLIEHDMRFVMSVSDRITVLNFGRRIALGTPTEIRRDPGVIEAYLGRPRHEAA